MYHPLVNTNRDIKRDKTKIRYSNARDFCTATSNRITSKFCDSIYNVGTLAQHTAFSVYFWRKKIQHILCIRIGTITNHHKCPCRIEISHLSGRNFNQGTVLPGAWLNSDPKGEISLPHMPMHTRSSGPYISSLLANSITHRYAHVR